MLTANNPARNRGEYTVYYPHAGSVKGFIMDHHEFQRFYEHFRQRYDHWDALLVTLCLVVPV